MLKLVRGWLLMGILLLAVENALSQDFSSAAAELATRIAASGAAGSFSFNLRNDSSIPGTQVSNIQEELLDQLQRRGWKIIAAGDSQNSISITLSENLSSYVWTTEINTGDKRDVVFLELPRPHAQAPVSVTQVPLSRTLLISSATPLLDVTLLDGPIVEGARLLALAPNSVQLYQLQSSQWHLLQTQPLDLQPLAARDLRGRIAPNQGGSFDAFLPGVHCIGSTTASLALTCRASDDPWPLSDDGRRFAFYAAKRNYFNGVIRVQGGQTESVDPFYSAAILVDRILYAEANGRLRIDSATLRTSSSMSQPWGTSIAGIESSCGSELMLATSPGDFRSADSITAFRASGDYSAVSEPISFSGPIVALKSSADRRQALAITESLSGRYEAYLLTARCGA